MEVQNKINKKGSLLDIFIVGGIVFGVVIALIFITTIMTQFETAFASTPIANVEEANTTFTQTVALTQHSDYIVLTAFIFLFIIVILLAAYLPADPIFIPIFIIFGLISIPISVVFSNTYEQFSSVSVISSTVTNYYPITTAIMTNLPLFFAAFTAILLIITYVKVSQ